GFNQRPSFDARPEGRPGFDGRFNGRPGFSTRPGFRDDGFWHRRHWHGGFWNGAFWPRVFYRPSFVSFWPVLPIGYATFWFGGVPYYYYDSLYYTWSPARYGYVVSDPPPAVETASTDSAPADESNAGGSANVYVYPRNGQSEEQTSTDRFECHQWAVSQT